MAIDFIDSESCNIDGEKKIYFMHPNVLRDRIIETYSSVGAKRFFSAKKDGREAMPEYFFALALKKATGKDWFLLQPEKDPPDFSLMTVSTDPIIITLDQFELVEIPERCPTFQKMMDIVKEKQNKGYPANYHLLIFINNEKSKEWINLLNEQLKNHYPFKTIWTIYLLWYKGKKNLYGSVVNRLRPYPIKSVEYALNDKALYQCLSMPSCIEELKVDGKSFFSFKSDFVKELTKKIRKVNLARARLKKVK